MDRRFLLPGSRAGVQCCNVVSGLDVGVPAGPVNVSGSCNGISSHSVGGGKLVCLRKRDVGWGLEESPLRF